MADSARAAEQLVGANLASLVVEVSTIAVVGRKLKTVRRAKQT